MPCVLRVVEPEHDELPVTSGFFVREPEDQPQAVRNIPFDPFQQITQKGELHWGQSDGSATEPGRMLGMQPP